MTEQLQYLPRKNTDCAKWDSLKERFGRDDLLPLWVADMDFRVAECVEQAIRRQAAQGIYGYYKVRQSYTDAFIDWESRRHGLRVCPEWMRYTPGVVPGIYWLLNALTAPRDAVIVLTPVYYPFMNAVKDTGRTLVCCDLVNSGGCYSIDFARFEQAIAENDVRVFILCSPHNPVGRVWTKDELVRLLSICRRHGVLVISDEIHHDFTYGEHIHYPTLSFTEYQDMVVMLCSASKTFNIAGLKNSFLILADETLRKRYDVYEKSICCEGGNPFGYAAAEAAFRGAEAWLEAIKKTVCENYEYAKARLCAALPQLRVSPLEGTYLMWLDFSDVLPPKQVAAFMEERCHLALDHGDWFTQGGCEGFVRLNLATSRENIETAVDALIGALTE